MPYARTRRNTTRRTGMRRNRRRNYRRRGATTRRITNFNSGNAFRPSVYPFVRSFENLVVLENPTGQFLATTTDNLVVGHVECSLNDLPNYGEFAGLFQQYKLNAVTLKCTPTYQLDTDPSSSETVIVDIWRSSHGSAPTANFNINTLLQIQRRQTFIMPQRKSFSRSMALTQLDEVYSSAYATQKPSYLDVSSDAGVPHYGINFCFRRPDGAPFTSVSPRLLMNYAVKLTCKQVT